MRAKKKKKTKEKNPTVFLRAAQISSKGKINDF